MSAAIVAVAVLVAGAAVVRLWRADEYEQRAKAAEARAETQRATADSLFDLATQLLQKSQRADTVTRRRAERVRVVDSTNPPPVSARPNIAARDSLIADLTMQRDSLRAAAQLYARAAAVLRASHDSLRRVLKDRPAARRLHGPSVGLGVGLGLCGDRPCASIGLTLNLGGLKL